MASIITTSPIKVFAQIKHFSNATLAGLDTAVNTFISGLDADVYNNYTIELGTSYFDGTNYVCAISFSRFENDSNWSASLA